MSGPHDIKEKAALIPPSAPAHGESTAGDTATASTPTPAETRRASAYFPEDERSHMNSEDFHKVHPDPFHTSGEQPAQDDPAPSGSAFGVAGSFRDSGTLGTFGLPVAPVEAEAPAQTRPVEPEAFAAPVEQEYFPEDERSHMEREDDHSFAAETAADSATETTSHTAEPSHALAEGEVLAATAASALSSQSSDAPPVASAGGGDGGDDGDGGEKAHGEEDEEEDPEEEAADRPMTLREHLRELRKRLLLCFAIIFVGFFACYAFAQPLFEFLMMPLVTALPESNKKLMYVTPAEAFFAYMKVVMVGSLFATSPLSFYQIWAFIAPGLHKEEKIYLLPIAFFSAVCFLSGAAFCYYVAFPVIFDFLMSFNSPIIESRPNMVDSLSFVLKLVVAFGVIFELPLFTFFLSRLGLVTAAWMRQVRRYAILASFIVAAILSPPDVTSMMLMAVPLLVLYEFSILVAAVFGKKPAPAAPADPDEEEEDEDDEDEEDEAAKKTAAAKNP